MTEWSMGSQVVIRRCATVDFVIRLVQSENFDSEAAKDSANNYERFQETQEYRL